MVSTSTPRRWMGCATRLSGSCRTRTTRTERNGMQRQSQNTMDVTAENTASGNGASAKSPAPLSPAMERLERRKNPRISQTPPSPAPPPRLADYASIIGQAQLDELYYLAEALRGKTMKMVNST